MTDRLIVFLVSHSSAGGAQEIWANLAEGFHHRGYKVRLMALYPYRADVRAVSEPLAWEYIVPRRPTTPLAQLQMLRAFVRFFKEEKPWRVFTALPAANMLAALAARLAGSPKGTVVTSHHSPADTHNRAIDAADSLTGCFGSVGRVVTVSDAVAASLDRKPSAYRAKRRTIHNALPPRIEAQLAALAERHRPRVARNRRVVATGRLAHQKNYPLLIRAARHMPDVSIEIVGGGPDEAALKALAAELGVTERIRFHGHNPRETTLEILAAGDVFAQVSLFEGHSLALVEAAKLGLPLVVSDVPVQIEGITAHDGTRCGIAVGVEEDEGLARAITALLDDPAHYDEWAGRARRLAEAATYDRMLKAYEDLLL